MRTRTLLTYLILTLAFAFVAFTFLRNNYYWSLWDVFWSLVAGGIGALLPTALIWAVWNLNIERRTLPRNLGAVADATDSEEKRKRDRLDSVLRDLSDEDLLRLRERLSEGAIDDDVLYDQLVGDDGELVQSSRGAY